MSPVYEEFRSHVDEAEGNGNTKIYDALSTAADELKTWHDKHPKAAMRVLCLTDGKDTASTQSAHTVAQKLQRLGITVDAVSGARFIA